MVSAEAWRPASAGSAHAYSKLSDITWSDQYPLSPRIKTPNAILAKPRPEPIPAPTTPPKRYEPPSTGRYRRRR
jgi:hypothetical protein